MNKTLLLFIVDFLFLNLIALTRWENAEPARPRQPPVPELAANAATKDQDLVETMRQSLADEQSARDQLARKLADADSRLSAREQGLAAAEAEKARLAATLSDTQNSADNLGRQLATAAEEATLTKDQLAQLQRDLEEKTAEAERQRQAVESLSKQQAEARKQIEGLTLAVVVAEADRQNLEHKARDLETQVQTERAERAQVEQSATRLAQGVGQLAQNSGELTKEIRDNRPVSANVLFDDFMRHRITASFSATRQGLFGPALRDKRIATVFTTDGERVFALLHVEDTIFSFEAPGDDWAQVNVTFDRPPALRTPATSIDFLALDPRVVVVPVTADQVASLGAKVYPIARDPFRFPEAVLISATGSGYGTVGFKLDPDHPGYVQVDNRLFKRIFGDFAPSRGDLVFSQTGELLGIMVNSDYCALIGNFAPASVITTGKDTASQQTGRLIDALSARVHAMPLALQ
jgi:hypothetical protein